MTEEPTRLPMFPLGAVVFPFTAITLRVFEPRYRALLEQVGNVGGRFGIVLIERGSEVGGGDARFGIGTLVEVIQVVDMEDDHKAVVLAGVGRLKVDRWLEDDPHPWAEVSALDFGEPPSVNAVDRLSALLDRVMALASELGADVFSAVERDVADEPLAAAYQLVAMSPLTPLDQQVLLTEDSPSRMVDSACSMLQEQAELLEARLGE
jgi:Lon protease-like protein